MTATPAEGARQIWPAPGIAGFAASGVEVAPDGTLVILHRAGRDFGDDATPIADPVIVRVDPATGTELARFGAGLFASPHGLSVGPNGDIWVTDTALNTVTHLDVEGTVLAVHGRRYPAWMEPMLRLRNLLPRLPVPMSADTFARPTDVAPLPDGGFAVTDGYRNARLARFDADGALVWERNARGGEAGEFHLPHGIAADAEGNLAVADRRNARLQLFSPDGSFLKQIAGDVVGRPYGVAYDAQGCLHVVDGGDQLDGGAPWGAVVTLSPDGAMLSRRGGPGPGLGEFDLPHDIAVGPDGTVYVAELGNSRVQALPGELQCSEKAR
jgi:DNA-binding beta-propeller fold protein YncE